MGFLRVFGRPPRVGVELGARTLKAAWVTRRVGGKTEWRYAERHRRDDAGAEDVSVELAHLLRPLRGQRFLATLTLAAPTSYVRTLSLQLADPKRLAEAVRDHLPTLLPFDVERAQVQFRLRRRQPVDGQWDCLISMAACETASLRRELQALWEAGWGARGVAPSALALLHTAKALEAIGQDPVVLIDIGERRTTMVLVEGGEAVYARDVALGTDHLIDALTASVSVGQDTVSLSREQAATLLEATGIPDPQAGGTIGPRGMPVATYQAMLQPILEQLVSEVRRTMTFGTHAARAATPGRVLVSGEGSRLPHCEPWLSRQLGVPVSRLNCERFVGASGATSAVTCGLALSAGAAPLDLQPASLRQRWALARAVWLIRQGIVIIALLLWLGAGAWWLRRGAASQQLSTLEARWREVQPIVTLQEAVDTHERLVRRLVTEEGVPVDWLQRLGRGFPNPVRLTKLSVGAAQPVRMDGQAQERERAPASYISEFTLWLTQAKLCQNTQLDATQPHSADETLVDFSLSCQRL